MKLTLITLAMIKFHSFDIFDTCLCRTCGSPLFVFDVMAKELFGGGKSACVSAIYDFIQLRRQGEWKAITAVRESGKDDPTLEEIYAHCDFTPITNIDKATIKAKELEVEHRVLRPIASTLDMVNTLHERGESVMYVSDMYLPSSFLREILSEQGFFKPGDEVYVSNEMGRTKSSGRLFDYIREKKGIRFSEWLHIGDNPYSDVQVPKKKGMKTRLVHNEPTYYERLLAKKDLDSSNLSVIKFSKLLGSVRKQIHATPQDVFAIDLIAPVYVPYVYLVMSQAVALGIEKLFFLARDGYIFYEIAKVFQPLFPSLSLHYLYVSRTSLYLPGLSDISAESLLKAIHPSYKTPHILDRLHLIHLLPQLESGSKLVGLDAIKWLLAQPVFVNELVKERKQQSECLIGYMRQEGLTDGICATVDLNGSRRCQQALNSVLTRYGHQAVMQFYLSVDSTRVRGTDYVSQIYSERTSLNPKNYSFSTTTFFEQYYSITNHRRTHSYCYDKVANRYCPVYEDDKVEDSFKTAAAQTNIRACCSVAQLMVDNRLTEDVEQIIHAGFSVNSEFYVFPRKDMLSVVKDLILTETSMDAYRLIPPFSLRGLINFKHQTWARGYMVWHLRAFGTAVLHLYDYLKLLRRKLVFR